MQARRSSAARPDSPRADAAARRLALIAADLGASSPTAIAPVDTDTAEAWWADHTRVAADRPAADRADVSSGAPARPLPPPLPQPGRHAARRPLRLPVPRISDVVRDRLPGLGPAHVAVVAVLVAVGLAITTWWVARDRPEQVAPVSAEPVAPLVGGGSSAPASPTAAASGGSVTVDVAGKVRRPGIVVLDQGARVTDALRAAGGPRRGVDLTPLNLARVLVDGEQIVVGGPSGAAPPTADGSAAGAPGQSGPLVNLNTAGQAELETLPGVGPVTAQAIIAWREQTGGFTSIDELLEVDGIGEKTLASLTPHVTV
jgi:competence protein ComEA